MGAARAAAPAAAARAAAGAAAERAGYTAPASVRSPTIRTLTAILVALLLTSAVLVGAAALLLGHRQAPVMWTDPVAQEPLPEPPARPDRLVRIPSVVPASVSMPTPMARQTATVRIAVRGADTGLPATAGVAILDGLTGAVLHWLPLPAPRASAVVLVTEVCTGAHWICLGDDEQTVRHAYRQREFCTVGEAGADVALDGALHPVEIRAFLGDAPAARTLFTLERGDDAHWHLPVAEPTTGLLSDDVGRLLLSLAAGDYRLRPIAQPGLRPFALRVPGPTDLRAEFRPQ